VKKELARHDANVRVYENDSLGAVRAADVVLLCVQPQQVADLFATAGICEALSEKLLISVLPGFTEQQLHGMIHANLPSSNQPESLIVRAIPNAAAAVRESMTVIGVSSLHLASERKALVDWIFTRIGKVIWVPSPSLDTYFALCGSGPAFYALLAESLATSAIAMGLQRDQAHELAAQTMRGTSGLLLRGDHPACVRERTSTPGGGTAAGLQVLEESGLRTTISKAFQQSKLPRGE
jgi:pyrroline-5-carboxylate reductase